MQVVRHLLPGPQITCNVVEIDDTGHLNPICEMNFLHGRKLPVTTLHPIKGNNDPGRYGAGIVNMTNRFADRNASGNDIVHYQYPPGKRRADEVSTFTMVFHLFAIETERVVIPALRQCNGDSTYQRNAFVGGAKQHVKRKLGSKYRF